MPERRAPVPLLFFHTTKPKTAAAATPVSTRKRRRDIVYSKLRRCQFFSKRTTHHQNAPHNKMSFVFRDGWKEAKKKKKKKQRSIPSRMLHLLQCSGEICCMASSSTLVQRERSRSDEIGADWRESVSRRKDIDVSVLPSGVVILIRVYCHHHVTTLHVHTRHIVL
jgi:hypothetical protein